MNRFDLEADRQVLIGDCGYQLDLAFDYEKAKAVGGRGSAAHSFLGTAILCLLHGLDEPAMSLLTKCEHWVTDSLAESEVPAKYLHDKRYSHDGEAALRYKTLATCNWLLHGLHDVDSLSRFVEHEDLFLASSGLGKDSQQVALIAPTFVDAGAYGRILELVADRWVTPVTLNRLRNEAQVCFVIAQHEMHDMFSRDAVQDAISKFLAARVGQWLNDGHSVRVAHWMKIVHWQQGNNGITPKAALLNCHRYIDQTNR
jgi:hypothetical protein